jgi:D-serine deaminase-like pyridoxal phosphate-dependent protein
MEPARSMHLREIETPALVIEAPRMEANIARMRARARALGVTFRPHVKTAKCLEVARLCTEGAASPITVSTLAEAEFFAAQGYRDILYAVGLAPNKLAHVLDLRRRGTELAVVTDSLELARLAGEAARAAGERLPVLIEIDSDGQRSGLKASDPRLVKLGRAIEDGGCALRGVMTHAGASYDCRSIEAIKEIAGVERDAAVSAAGRLRAAGLACPIVSVGSTPTATYVEHLEGVTELRAGVFVFFDLVMAGISVCRESDIALSVVASVIGHQRDKGWAIVDAGWRALSRDRGTAAQPLDQGYGVVCDENGEALNDVIVKHAHQEHGILSHRSGDPARMPQLPVGALVRILPNHACATAGQFREYNVVRGDARIEARWQRLAD